MEFDQEGSDEGRARVWLRARPGAVGRAFGEAGPGQAAEQRAILLDQRVALDPGGQWGVGVSERAAVKWHEWRADGPALEGSAEALE